jgi:3-oxoacyl-[acyl-carrier-protein] synthase II
MSPLHSVVITGMGVTSPLGHCPDALLDQLLAGVHALRPIEAFDTTAFACRLGAQVTDFKARDWVSNRKNLKLMSPAVRYGLAAIKRAWADAGLDEQRAEPARTGMFVGAGTAVGNAEDLLPALERGFVDGAFDLVAFAENGVDRVSPLWLLKGLSNNVLGFASADLDAQGVNQNYCSSAVGGLQAIGEAAWSLAEGLADVVLAGGSDSALDPAHLTGFSRLTMLTGSTEAYPVRPFDAAHSGFVPGEGAAFFALERAEHAEARGAKVLARVAGYGNATDAAHLPTGGSEAITRAGQRALELAGWAPGEVDLIYAHGNGSPSFDVVEAKGLLALLDGAPVPVTTNKAQIGHTVAASGPISVICALAAARRGVVPGLPGFTQAAPGCEALNISAQPRTQPIRRVLIHAAGLGGQSTMLALEIEP